MTADPHADPAAAPPAYSPHETWLTTVAFVAVLAVVLSGLSLVKIINSGDKLIQGLALGLAVVALAGVAAFISAIRRAGDEEQEEAEVH